VTKISETLIQYTMGLRIIFAETHPMVLKNCSPKWLADFFNTIDPEVEAWWGHIELPNGLVSPWLLHCRKPWFGQISGSATSKIDRKAGIFFSLLRS